MYTKPTEQKRKTVAKLDHENGGGGGAYIPKKFYTKTTYITLLSEKFGGSGVPPGPS
ncbi:hypothetical protein Hanom_Chr12g01181911 [Helianthus anomalus]